MQFILMAFMAYLCGEKYILLNVSTWTIHCKHRCSNPDIPLDVYSFIQGCPSVELYIAWNLCLLKLYKIQRFLTKIKQTRYPCMFINLQEKRCCLTMYASTAEMARWLKMRKSEGWKKSSALCVRSAQHANKATQ